MQATIAFRSIRGFQTNTVCTKPRDVLKVTISFRKQGTRNSSSPGLPTRFTSRLMTGLYTRGLKDWRVNASLWAGRHVSWNMNRSKWKYTVNWTNGFGFRLFSICLREIVLSLLNKLYICDHKLYRDYWLWNLWNGKICTIILSFSFIFINYPMTRFYLIVFKLEILFVVK